MYVQTIEINKEMINIKFRDVTTSGGVAIGSCN